MKRIRKAGNAAAAALLVISLSFAVPVRAAALEASELVPVGSTVGIQLKMDGVMVVGFAELETDGGKVCPARDAGIMPGDMIVRLGSRDTASAAEFLSAASELDGEKVSATVMREGKQIQFNVTPVLADNGSYQLGLWLRDGVSGIGTVTFYDPESGMFGALGHGINDLDTGKLLPAEKGSICGSSVVDVIKGEQGKPGELCGRFDKENELGSITNNTDCGIFGMYRAGGGDTIPVAEESDVHLGDASILSNVSGDEVTEYAVEISRIYHDSEDGRFIMITVKDERLLETTGGIVQGMSGSPIIQDGKLVGAVTHVLVNDPTRGYGIFIENMLDAAG